MQLERLIGLLRLVANVRIETGKLTSPNGEDFTGFIITIGEITNPASIQRSYEDINKIFKANPGNYKVSEHRDSEGHFKSFSVET